MENQNEKNEKLNEKRMEISSGENPKNKKLIWVIFLILIVIIALAGAFFFISKRSAKKSGMSPEKVVLSDQKVAEAMKNIQEARQQYFFPKFNYEKSAYAPSLPDYKINLAEIGNLKSFDDYLKLQGGKAISLAQKDQLVKDNFFVSENLDHFYGDDLSNSVTRSDDWSGIYKNIGGCTDPTCRRPDGTVFITSDFLLHAYHRLLEKEFEYIEQKEFYPKLKNISQTMMEKAIADYTGAQDPEYKASLERIIAYFAVPSAMLDSASADFQSYQSVLKSGEIGGNDNLKSSQSDAKEAVLANLEKIKNKIPAVSYQDAKAELELIMAAEGPQDSPLFGKYQQEAGLSFQEDYTQFTPRSHYSKNSILRTYFRSMMWYGRGNFLLSSPELTRDAINITLMLQRTGLQKDWEDIYVPTSFFVGESDDLSFIEYGEALKSIGKNETFDQNSIGEIQTILKGYKNPQIMSSVAAGDKVLDLSKEELQAKTKGFRFMGQRFTPDAFVFSTLTQGDEKPDPATGEKLPSMPTALMVMTALDNKTASPLLSEWEDKNAPDSKKVIDNRMSSLKKYFGGLNDSDWTQNIYWSWLYTIKSLFQDDMDKTGYPMFMKAGNWNYKNLQCSLGSWTELKHDTLLYAKQSYAEWGGGGEEEGNPPVPKGYVEPNIEFFDRLIPLVQMTKDGLSQRSLLDNIFVGRNEQLFDSLQFLRKIAIAEINNEAISDDDFERLRTEAYKFDAVMASLPDESHTEDLARSALIADVHTDAVSNQILYEANGIPNYVYAAVKDKNGTRLTKGLVFSHYEFKAPLATRLKDEDWRKWVYQDNKNQMPAMSDWEKSLIK